MVRSFSCRQPLLTLGLGAWLCACSFASEQDIKEREGREREAAGAGQESASPGQQEMAGLFTQAGSSAQVAFFQKGFSPPPALAQSPRFKQSNTQGLRAMPDGDLAEWGGSGVDVRIRWIELRQASSSARGWSGPGDLRARAALASYGSGLSLAIKVQDDVHRPATCASALSGSDHVELELTPVADRAKSSKKRQQAQKLVGIHLRLGTIRQLVDLVRPAEEWRAAAVASAGTSVSGGYIVEARLPLFALTPLPQGRVTALRYRITLFDADAESEKVLPTLRAEGIAQMDPPLEVPEAVQRRGSVRACLAAEPGALFGYQFGWRCAVPYKLEGVAESDTRPVSGMDLSYIRVPEPPRIVWIRERVLFVNFPGADRGLAALFDQRKTLLSLLRLGVVSAEDPGNALSKDSGAEPFKLPDGTWALAVTHAVASRTDPTGGRCAGGHRVYLSVLALREAYTSTPHKPAPEPRTPPHLEEIFRALLDDCRASVANDWSLSKDRRTVTIHSSLFPNRVPTRYVFDGRMYRKAQ